VTYLIGIFLLFLSLKKEGLGDLSNADFVIYTSIIFEILLFFFGDELSLNDLGDELSLNDLGDELSLNDLCGLGYFNELGDFLSYLYIIDGSVKHLTVLFPLGINFFALGFNSILLYKNIIKKIDFYFQLF
jgi:hypothetical protein